MGSEGTLLFVANPGGHVDELVRLADRLDTQGRHVVWVTAETTQTKSLLAGRHVEFVPSIGPRNAGKAAFAIPGALAMIRRTRAIHVVSTGAALAVPYLISARILGRSVTFIESAARQQAPSATGRLAELLPGVDRRTQAAVPFGKKWTATGSVFDGYVCQQALSLRPVKRIVVSLGGERFPFRRAVEQVRLVVPPEVEITWQIGSTKARDIGTNGAWVRPEVLRAAMREADAVLVHSGVGSALAALDAGKLPVLLVRERKFGEHVDDHQREIAVALEKRDLAIAPSLEMLSWDLVQLAASRSVVQESKGERIPL